MHLEELSGKIEILTQNLEDPTLEGVLPKVGLTAEVVEELRQRHENLLEALFNRDSLAADKKRMTMLKRELRKEIRDEMTTLKSVIRDEFGRDNPLLSSLGMLTRYAVSEATGMADESGDTLVTEDGAAVSATKQADGNPSDVAKTREPVRLSQSTGSDLRRWRQILNNLDGLTSTYKAVLARRGWGEARIEATKDLLDRFVTMLGRHQKAKQEVQSETKRKDALFEDLHRWYGKLTRQLRREIRILDPENRLQITESLGLRPYETPTDNVVTIQPVDDAPEASEPIAS
jgi:hypothetical protein